MTERSPNRNITLRIDSSILDELAAEAERNNTSINTLASKVLARHARWHSKAYQAGFIPVRKELVKSLLERIDYEEALELGKRVARKDTKQLALFLRGSYSPGVVLEVFETWLDVCGCAYRHEVEGDMHMFVIQHGMGRKWSLYLAGIFQFYVDEFKTSRTSFEAEEDTLTFSMEMAAAAQSAKATGAKGAAQAS
jgi:hypothetical protein